MGGRTATDEALLIGAYARSNSLLHPRNAALMGEFIKTRNPEVWDQLVANLKKTPQRAQTEAEQARSLAESQIVNFLTQNMGGGDYAEHMIAAGDPIQMASLLVPYLKAGKLIGGAGRTTGGVVREIAKTAMTEMGIESLQTLVENPDAKLSEFEQRSLNYLMGTLGMAAMNKGVSKVAQALPGNLPVPNEKNGSSGDVTGGAAGTPPEAGGGAQATAAPAGVPKPEKAPALAAAAEAVPQPDEVPEAVAAGGNKVQEAPWEANPQGVTGGPNTTNAPQAVGAASVGGASPPGLVAQQGGGQPATGGSASSMPPAQIAGSGSGSSSGGSASSAGGGAGTPLQAGGGNGPAASGGQVRGSSGVSASGQQGNSSQSAAKAQEDGANPHSKDTANDHQENIATSGEKKGRMLKPLVLKWDNPKSGPTYGHLFLEHGRKKTKQQLWDRARGLGHQVGQFLDDDATASFVAKYVQDKKPSPGVHHIDLPDDLPVRILLPDGKEISGNKIFILFKSDGSVKTGFPYNDLFPIN